MCVCGVLIERLESGIIFDECVSEKELRGSLFFLHLRFECRCWD